MFRLGVSPEITVHEKSASVELLYSQVVPASKSQSPAIKKMPFTVVSLAIVIEKTRKRKKNQQTFAE